MLLIEGEPGRRTVANSFRGLERPPKARELHHWADYAELNCLASPDSLYSPAQLADHFKRGRDSGEVSDLSTQGDAVLDEQALDSLLGLTDEDVDTAVVSELTWDSDRDEEGNPLTGGPLTDSFTRQADDIWRYLRYRSGAFGDSWPFAIDPVARTLTLKSLLPELSVQQRVYIFLLLCSSLRYVQANASNALTRAFERVAYQAFIVAFPGWEVHIFGTAATDGSRYDVGQLWERLLVLSADLRCRILAEREDFSDRDVGDNGLDLVAWLPLPERSKGLPMAFGQCACSPSEWRKKQSEVSEERWGEVLRLASPISNWTFIPFCFHNPQGDWETPHHVNKGILVDRLRLFSLLESRMDEVKDVVEALEIMK